MYHIKHLTSVNFKREERTFNLTYFGGRRNEKQKGVNVSQPLRYISSFLIPLS